MKKTALVLALISILLFLVVGVFFVNLVKGNATFHIGEVEILTPENKTYYSSTLTLSYHATFSSELEHRWIVYSLDGGPNVTVYDEYNHLQSYTGSVTLSGLSSGSHVIFICSKKGSYVFGTGRSGDWFDFPDEVHFTIDLSGKSPTPTPTLAPTSKPTATPEPTPYEETGVQNTSQFMVNGGAAALVSIIVFLGMLIYYIKRK